MKHVWWLFIAAALGGCASETPATPAERDAANLSYIACLDKAARDLDDSRSDASSVAIGVRSVCAGEYWTAMRLQSRGMNMQQKAMFEQMAERKQIDYATGAVLRVRAERSKAGRQ